MSIGRQLREHKICHLTLVSKAYPRLVTHTTFQELHLTPFNLHEILEFEILSSQKHFFHEEIFQILFRAEVYRPWVPEFGQNTWRVVQEKNEGPLGKKIAQKSRNSQWLSCGGVGA